MKRKLFVFCVALSALLPIVSHGQEKSDACPDLPGLTSATHSFRRLGETLEIPIRGDNLPPGREKCEPVTLALHWSNGRNNGSLFDVTFLDDTDRPVFAKQISGFLSGVSEFPLAAFELQRVSGSSLGIISVPTRITIQAVRPFAPPVALSYRVISVPHAREKLREREATPEQRQAVRNNTEVSDNEVAAIHHAVRLIGATRLLLVQLELRTDHPFPVSDIPLRLQVGKKVFSDELSGDYTGRKLTLSLTPELFAELQEGDEIVAFLKRPEGTGEPVWNFGKLRKAMLASQ